MGSGEGSFSGVAERERPRLLERDLERDRDFDRDRDLERLLERDLERDLDRLALDFFSSSESLISSASPNRSLASMSSFFS